MPKIALATFPDLVAASPPDRQIAADAESGRQRIPRHPNKVKLATARAIRQARLAMGIDQSELAREIGVSKVAVGQWERGQFMPHITHLQAMKEYFCLSLDELTGDPQPRFPSRRRKATERHEHI